MSQAQVAEHLFSGAGLMGERMRQMDWSQTPLGPVEAWPQSLRTAVRIMLTSRYAMWMLWGNDFTFFCNDAYLPTVGVKQSWVLGASSKKVWEEIWPDIGPRIEHVLKTGQATWDEGLLLFLERSGYPEETYHTFSYSPLPDDDGVVRGMLCVVTEETDRIIGERRLALLRDLASNLGTSEQEVFHAAARCVADGRDFPFGAVYLHDQQTREFDLVSPNLSDAVANQRWPLQEVIDEGQIKLVELPSDIDFPHGRWDIPSKQALAWPIAQPGQTSPAGVFVAGLNPYRPLDEAYRSFIGLFVGQIASGLANARAYAEERRRAEALAEVDRAKTAFFSNVSHEFRTPLTLMLSPVEDLLKSGSLEPASQEQISLVHRNGLRLLKLVNTLLAFSRIEAGRVQASYELVDLAKYTADLASVFRSAMEKAGLKFTIECPPLNEPVYVDRDMWEKIVLNLLSNAFKFTLHGGVAVSLEQNDGKAFLRVGDTGSGIPAQELPHLFERFHRVDGTRGRTHEGTGIGLALVQEFVKLHGGEIRVTSELEKGSTFLVEIPTGKAHLPEDRIFTRRSSADLGTGASVFAEEAMRWLPSSAEGEVYETNAEVQDASSSSAALEQIVLADDNADMREYVRKLLSSRYDVTAVADGQEALDAIRKRRPALVLSDVMMPNLDGFGLLRTLRADKDFATLPIILLSARAGEEATIEGIHAGADDYLVKPFSARELLARVETQIQRTRLDRALRESEHRFRSIADTAPAMFWITEPDGHCSYLSRGWYEFTGQPLDEGLGFGWTKMVHPEDQAAGREAFLRANSAQASYTIDYRVRKADGGFGWILDQGRPRFDEQGNFLGFIGSVIDIDARKRAEAELMASQQREQAVLSAAEIGHWSWDVHSNQVEIDANLAALQGRKPAVAMTTPIEDIFATIHPDDVDGIRKATSEALASGKFVMPDHRYVRPDNSIRWVAGRGHFTRDSSGTIARADGIVIDVTDRKKLELEIERALTSERTAREEAERINRLKDEFLATLSHELRTPLNAILGWSQILMRKKSDEADLRRGLEAIDRNARAQTQMIEDLLDMSRIISGKVRLDLQPISPVDVIEQAMQSVLPTAANKGIELIRRVEPEPFRINADAGRLQQVVWNLLTNAIKFTPAGGRVFVAVKRIDSTVEISVTDTGEGIGPEFLPFVFQRFRQADGSTTRRHGGLGLGLSIVKNIVELHGGTVHAHSEGHGKGAVFFIRLPLHDLFGRSTQTAPPHDYLESAARSPSTLQGVRVLVVDDDPDARELVKRILVDHHAHVEMASSAKEAIDLLREKPAALMVSDIAMPEVDGYELIRKVRAMSDSNRTVPAIAMTAFARSEDRQRALQAGFQMHIAKPLDPAELIAACAALVAR